MTEEAEDKTTVEFGHVGSVSDRGSRDLVSKMSEAGAAMSKLLEEKAKRRFCGNPTNIVGGISVRRHEFG